MIDFEPQKGPVSLRAKIRDLPPAFLVFGSVLQANDDKIDVNSTSYARWAPTFIFPLMPQVKVQQANDSLFDPARSIWI